MQSYAYRERTQRGGGGTRRFFNMPRVRFAGVQRAIPAGKINRSARAFRHPRPAVAVEFPIVQNGLNRARTTGVRSEMIDGRNTGRAAGKFLSIFGRFPRLFTDGRSNRDALLHLFTTVGSIFSISLQVNSPPAVFVFTIRTSRDYSAPVRYGSTRSNAKHTQTLKQY